MKKGVTLMALAITIVVMIIILGTIVTGLSLAVTDTEMGAYAQDLRMIEEAVTIKMTENEYDFLVKSAITKDEILKTIDADKANQLTEEFELNGDIDSNEFYIVDITKLALKRNKYGKEKVLPNAIVISKDTANIYYVKGKKFKGKTYFSTSSRLLRIAKIKEEEDAPSQDVNLTEKMHITKLTKSYSNKIEFKIVTDMKNSEQIYLTCGNKEINITNKINNSRYVLDTTSGFTITELEEAKTVKFSKKIGSKVLDEKEIQLGNYDGTSPTKLQVKISDVAYKSYLFVNTQDNKTKDVKEYIYVLEYCTGKKIPTQTTELKNYIINKGRRVKTNKIFLPDGLSKVAVMAIDSAGNYSEPVTKSLYVKGMPTIYPGLQRVDLPSATTERNLSKYDTSNIKYESYANWVTAKAPDGSYFVWIPRFAYRIVYYDTPVKNNTAPNPGRILGYSDNRGIVDKNGNPNTSFDRSHPLVDIYLLGSGENKYKCISGSQYQYDVSKTDNTNNPKHLMVHPAFSPLRRQGFSAQEGNYGWNSEVTGFWVSKYEMSAFGDTCKSIPGATSETLTASQAFDKAVNYSLKTFAPKDVQNYTSMLITNTQWGAVSLLTTAAYGNYPTANTTNVGSTPKILDTSTTKNRTGIYDMSGLSYDLVSAYVANGDNNLNVNAKSLVNAKNTKFVDVYRAGNTADEVLRNNMDKYGDGISEMGYKVTNGVTEATITKNIPYGYMPLFTRGGIGTKQQECGIYSVHGNTGNQPGTGYRIVLAMPDGNAD